MSLKHIRRAIYILILLLLVYFATASATFLIHIHAANESIPESSLSDYPPPPPNHSLLIFSPHPDDETLGCAGLIQDALHNGSSVHVAFLTNGDGFRLAAEREFHRLNLSSEDMIKFGNIRQNEAINALGKLGVPRSDVLFLGYPDQGLTHLWEKHWSSSNPYTSPTTGVNFSPYSNCFHPGTKYCGSCVLADIKDLIRKYKPTDLYVTHPLDEHPDHSAASSFVTLALAQMQMSDPTLTSNCHLHYYLVHRGDWPVPQGLFRKKSLTPPAEMADLDTRWSALPLTPHEENRKIAAIDQYASQTALMKRFLLSFVRTNEIFGDLPVKKIDSYTPSVDTNLGLSNIRWLQPPIIEDPVDDNLLCNFLGAGDIRNIYAVTDGMYMYLKISTSEPITSKIQYSIKIRYFGNPTLYETGGMYTMRCIPGKPTIPNLTQSLVSKNFLYIRIPLRDIGYSHLIGMCVASSVMGIQEDTTGYHILQM